MISVQAFSNDVQNAGNSCSERQKQRQTFPISLTLSHIRPCVHICIFTQLMHTYIVHTHIHTFPHTHPRTRPYSLTPFSFLCMTMIEVDFVTDHQHKHKRQHQHQHRQQKPFRKLSWSSHFRQQNHHHQQPQQHDHHHHHH